MSDFKITKPGFYRQRNGGKAEVLAVRGEWALAAPAQRRCRVG